jgi:hypothetical protein
MKVRFRISTKLPLRYRETTKAIIRAFPDGLRTADLSQQKQMGLDALNRHTSDPRFQMEIKRIVELPL